MSGNAGTDAARTDAARRDAARRAPARRTRGARSGNRMLAAFAVLAALFVLGASRVHVNASWSDDAWGYVLLPMGAPRTGDVVIFDPPETLGAPAPYLKTVRGLPGAAVAVDAERRVWIDGERAGMAKAKALDGRGLDPVAGGTIPQGHYYLHADHRDSHDSRYAEIGLVPRERILGRAVALPDVPWLGLQGPLVKPPCGSCGQQACGQQTGAQPDGGQPICKGETAP